MPLILVLGANGFIGRQVAAALMGRPGIEVAGAGLGAPTADLERDWIDLDLLAGDDRLTAELRSLKPAVLVNCTGATVGSAATLICLNVLTTDAILGSLDRSGLATRLVHFGSAAEYGPGPVDQYVGETACARPVAPYGIAKLAATQLVLAAAAQGREAVVMRVFNALGPGMPDDSLAGSAARRLTEAAAASSPRVEFGPLGSVRDFIDVRDVAGAAVSACLVPRLAARVVNVGTGQGHAARDLVAEIAEAVGYRGQIAEGAAGSPRSADVPWQVADISLAQMALGWQPIHGLRSSVAFMLARG